MSEMCDRFDHGAYIELSRLALFFYRTPVCDECATSNKSNRVRWYLYAHTTSVVAVRMPESAEIAR